MLDTFMNLDEMLLGLEWFDGIGMPVGKDLRKAILNARKSVFPSKSDADAIWKETESMVESLWVGGMLYADEIADKMAGILRNSAELSLSLGVISLHEPPFGLSYSSYFSRKYSEYYGVYSKAGCDGLFAPKGQERLDALAFALHEREEFFQGFLSSFDGNDGVTLDEIGKLLDGFPGVDRRVEIIRSLTHESEMVYGAFSTFDPMNTIRHLVDEIRADFYGGCYVPAGEDEASYECIVPQLREKWLDSNR